MRKSPALTALFPGTRQAILAATMMHPERWWYLSDLARRLRLKPSSLQRELKNLERAGILRFRKDGNRAYYQADDSSPFFAELRGIITKSAGLIDVLRAVLGPLQSRIAVAFVFGSVAEGREKSASDVDLCVIGKLTLAELAPAIRRAEGELERTVSVIHYTPKEFAHQTLRSHFLSEIAGRAKLLVIGDENELEQIARGGSDRSAPVVDARTRRDPRSHRAKSKGRRAGGTVGG